MTAPRSPQQPKRLDAGIFQAEISSFALRLAAEGKAAKTIRTYTEAVQWFAAARLPGRAGWEQAGRQDIQQWMAWLLGRYSSAYASNQYRALQQFFKWLAAEGELPDPMQGLQPPRIAGKLVPVVTSQELTRLEQACAGRSSRSAATPRSSRCSPRPASGWPSWPTCGTTAVTRGAVTSTCGSGRSPSEAGAASPGPSRSATRPPGAWTGTARPHRHAQAWRPQLWLGAGNRELLTAAGIYQMTARRGRQAGVDAYPHRFRHHFSHTWLDRGGPGGDLMELAGWASPQMLRRYGASARSARARRTYDRIMTDT